MKLRFVREFLGSDFQRNKNFISFSRLSLWYQVENHKTTAQTSDEEGEVGLYYNEILISVIVKSRCNALYPQKKMALLKTGNISTIVYKRA